MNLPVHPWGRFRLRPLFYQFYPNLPPSYNIFPIFSLSCSKIETVTFVEVDVVKLKELRTQRVMTITQLADKAGVSKNTISKAERGGSVYPSSVHKIASALGVEPSELVKAS